MGIPAVLFDLHSRGFQLKGMGDRLMVEPASKLTDELRATIRAHKPEILAALESHHPAVNQPVLSPPGEPYDATEAVREAIEERDAIMADGGVPSWRRAEVIELAEQFYNHVFGPAKATGCCHAPTGRYCQEGERLRDAYYGRCQ